MLTQGTWQSLRSPGLTSRQWSDERTRALEVPFWKDSYNFDTTNNIHGNADLRKLAEVRITTEFPPDHPARKPFESVLSYLTSATSPKQLERFADERHSYLYRQPCQMTRILLEAFVLQTHLPRISPILKLSINFGDFGLDIFIFLVFMQLILGESTRFANFTPVGFLESLDFSQSSNLTALWDTNVPKAMKLAPEYYILWIKHF